jgi:hypothetical protein
MRLAAMHWKADRTIQAATYFLRRTNTFNSP